MHISACVRETLTLPRNRCGLGISSFKHLAEKKILLKRHALRYSSSADMRQVWKDSSVHHVVTDEFLISSTSSVTAAKLLKTAPTQQSTAHLHGLQLQGITTKTIVETVSKVNISLWSSTIEHTSAVLHNYFARKAMLQVLPTASNRSSKQTTYVLLNCGSPTA